MARATYALLTRLSEKIEVRADGCWEWIGAQFRGGYGSVRIDGRTHGAHRVVYALVHGDLSPDEQIDHLCRNRACVNPAHMEVVTSKENTMRGESFSAKNARKTRCPRGHAYDETNTYRYRGSRYCRACYRDRRRSRSR
jgi:hypothetical protein